MKSHLQEHICCARSKHVNEIAFTGTYLLRTQYSYSLKSQQAKPAATLLVAGHTDEWGMGMEKCLVYG